MKKIIFSTLLSAFLFTSLSLSVLPVVRADDAPSAPNVVAPAQPAAVQNTNPAEVTTTKTATTTTAPASASPLGMALPFVVMLAVMYFLMIRPQQKRMKDQQTLISSLKNGDEVVTSSGILGTIMGMSEKVVTLEVAKNVQLKILRSQVNQIVKGQIQDIQPTN
jgi:preprotein translocase subunit YajC